MTCFKILNNSLQLSMGHELRSVSFQRHEFSRITQKKILDLQISGNAPDNIYDLFIQMNKIWNTY